MTIELESTARPITVKLNTEMHGESIMVRWLEITNRGTKATAITAMSPWSGLLWNTAGYSERVGQEAPFEVAMTKYEIWGHEGAWEFHPVENGTLTVSSTRGKSDWGHPTFFARNRATGEWFVASLAWSGNWTMHVQGTQDTEKDEAHIFFDLGPSAADPVIRVLEPGEMMNRIKDGFLENTQYSHVEALYATFDHLRKQFPNVIFQNCAAGGGRLDYGIMQRFQNTELSDWLRAPRGLKILNGMTWVLPPEIMLRTSGTESSGLEDDGGLDVQLDTIRMLRPIFRGISPSLLELNPLLATKIRQSVDLYKQTLYAIMNNGVVYYHTPVLPMMEPSPWVVRGMQLQTRFVWMKI